MGTEEIAAILMPVILSKCRVLYQFLDHNLKNSSLLDLPFFFFQLLYVTLDN